MRRQAKTAVGDTKVNEVTAVSPVSTKFNVNLCNEGNFRVRDEFLINHTDLGHQVMILDLGAPVSLAGIQWLEQYFGEFNLTIKEMESSPCHQIFTFGPSKRYLSKSIVKIPIIVQRNDGKDDVLKVKAYLVDTDIPFLCRKELLSSDNQRLT